jgi:GMP synthase (glutamine-hydrolysing)
MQIGCQILGCNIDKAESREFGRARLTIRDAGDLLSGIPENTAVWMSHGDQVQTVSS